MATVSNPFGNKTPQIKVKTEKRQRIEPKRVSLLVHYNEAEINDIVEMKKSNVKSESLKGKIIAISDSGELQVYFSRSNRTVGINKMFASMFFLLQ